MAMNSLVYERIAAKLGLSAGLVKDVYENGFFGFLLDKITSLPLDRCKRQEEFDKLKTNFRIPMVGSFYVKFGNSVKLYGHKNIIEYAKNKKSKTNAESRDSDS